MLSNPSLRVHKGLLTDSPHRRRHVDSCHRRLAAEEQCPRGVVVEEAGAIVHLRAPVLRTPWGAGCGAASDKETGVCKGIGVDVYHMGAKNSRMQTIVFERVCRDMLPSKYACIVQLDAIQVNTGAEQQ